MTTTYIVNRTPSSALEGKTREEKWSGKVPDYSYLRIFGCTVYCHRNLGKLDPGAQKCMFLGYPEGIKGYRLWARGHGGYKMITSRNVAFNEEEMPCLEKQMSADPENPNVTRFQVELGSQTDSVSNNRGENEPTLPQTQTELEHLGVQEHEQTEMNDPNQQSDVSDYQLTRDRPRRNIREPTRYEDYLSYSVMSYNDLAYKESKTYNEAMSCNQSGK